MDDDATRLLAALREAGCNVFVEDGQVFCSPPARHIEWPDPEQAIDELHDELLDLIATAATVH